MSIDVIRKSIAIDEDFDLNTSRILILISVLNARMPERVINGIEKLAKFDFLLRHPTILQNAIGNSTVNLNTTEYEKISLETQYAEFKFKPWDSKYRQYAAILEARGLILLSLNERDRIEIKITNKGIAVADKLTGTDAFKTIVERSKLIKTYFRSSSSSRLSKVVQGAIPRKTSFALKEMVVR